MPISWLNHKPHAIAVYASWPALPSAHATLATGRPATALPGPVLHRLDCTSFCWRLRKHGLGFKHYCGTRRDGGGFVLGRKPMAKRMRTKLREIKERLMATRHDGIQGKWLAQVLRGWMAYYAVPMSGSAISAFRHHMIERWHGAL